jgi:hypothetical protein
MARERGAPSITETAIGLIARISGGIAPKQIERLLRDPKS